MNNSNQQIITIGTGCSIRGWSDVHACRVVDIKHNGKTLVVQKDKATLLNGVNSGEKDALKFEPGGFCGHTSGIQRWKLEEDKNGAKTTFTFRKNGLYVRKGENMKGTALHFVHTHYYDFNF